MLNIFLGETVGTFVLILLGCGVCAAVSLKKTNANNSDWIVIAFGWAMAVMVGATIAGSTGGHLNPAVSIAFFLTGQIGGLDMLVYFCGELLGAFLGALLVIVIYWDHFKLMSSEDNTIGVFATGPAIKNTSLNLLNEIMGTFVLIFALFMNATLSGTGMYAPLFAGLVVLAIGLSLGSTTGYAINPARDLMPRLAYYIMPVPNKSGANWGYAWIPVVGPILGALLAVALLYIGSAIGFAPIQDFIKPIDFGNVFVAPTTTPVIASVMPAVAAIV